MQELKAIIIKTLRANKKENLIFAIAVPIFAVIVLVVEYLTGTYYVILTLIVMLSPFVTIYLFFDWYRNRNIEKSAVYKMLFVNPENLKGYFIKEHHFQGSKPDNPKIQFYKVNFVDQDNKSCAINIKKKEEFKRVRALIEQNFPNIKKL